MTAPPAFATAAVPAMAYHAAAPTAAATMTSATICPPLNPVCGAGSTTWARLSVGNVAISATTKMHSSLRIVRPLIPIS